MRSSSKACSVTASTSFNVETWCCASTKRQQRPASARASDDSAAGVQVVDDIHQSGNRLDQGEGLGVEGSVGVLEPSAGNCVVAAHDCVERTVETHEEDRELE